eukprot:4417923-Ditylum_brightwellii.AAC.1
MLPLHEEYAGFHPVLVDLSQLEQGLSGKHSLGYQQIIITHKQIHSEYDEFAQVSKSFACQAIIEECLSFYITVQYQAFHVSEFTKSKVLKEEPTIQKEKEYYQQTIENGVDEYTIAIMPVNNWRLGLAKCEEIYVAAS